MSWLLAGEEHEKQGFMTEACRGVLTHLFGSLGWTSAVSYIDPENTASLAVATRLGATLDPAAAKPAALAHCLAYRHHPPEAAA